MGLADFKDAIAIIATICTIANMFSGLPVCINIYKKKNTEGKDPNPFIGGIGMGVLMLFFARIMKIKNPFTYYIIHGVCLNIITNIACFIVFCIYSSNKKELYKKFGIIGVITFALSTYAYFEDLYLLKERWGLMVISASFLLTATPLLNRNQIIQTKNTDMLPFAKIVGGTIVSFLWLIYGIVLDDIIIIFQNVIELLIQCFILSYVLKYPSNGDKKLESKEKEQKIQKSEETEQKIQESEKKEQKIQESNEKKPDKEEEKIQLSLPVQKTEKSEEQEIKKKEKGQLNLSQQQTKSSRKKNKGITKSTNNNIKN